MIDHHFQHPVAVIAVTPALRRAVLSHAGVSSAELAALLGCGAVVVRTIRASLGRDLEDGQPGIQRAAAQPSVDVERLMRTNRGVL